MGLRDKTFGSGVCMRIFFFKLEDNCFTMLCWFLPYISVNQP